MTSYLSAPDRNKCRWNMTTRWVLHHTCCFFSNLCKAKIYIVRWLNHPFEKNVLVKLDHIPPFSGWNMKTCLRCHHLDINLKKENPLINRKIFTPNSLSGFIVLCTGFSIFTNWKPLTGLVVDDTTGLVVKVTLQKHEWMIVSLREATQNDATYWALRVAKTSSFPKFYPLASLEASSYTIPSSHPIPPNGKKKPPGLRLLAIGGSRSLSSDAVEALLFIPPSPPRKRRQTQIPTAFLDPQTAEICSQCEAHFFSPDKVSTAHRLGIRKRGFFVRNQKRLQEKLDIKFTCFQKFYQSKRGNTTSQRSVDSPTTKSLGSAKACSRTKQIKDGTWKW